MAEQFTRLERTPEEVKRDLQEAIDQKKLTNRRTARIPEWLEKEEQETFAPIPLIRVEQWLRQHNVDVKHGPNPPGR